MSIGRAALDDDLAPVEHRDAVGDAEGRRHVVADDDAGHAGLFRDVADHVVDVLGGDRVEAGRRLIV